MGKTTSPRRRGPRDDCARRRRRPPTVRGERASERLAEHQRADDGRRRRRRERAPRPPSPPPRLAPGRFSRSPPLWPRRLSRSPPRVSARAIFVAHPPPSPRAPPPPSPPRPLRLRLGHRVRLDGRPLAALTAASDTALVAVATNATCEGGSLAPRAREFEPRRRRHRAFSRAPPRTAAARATRKNTTFAGRRLRMAGTRAANSRARGVRGGGGPPRQRAPDAAEHETLSQASHGGARGVREERAVVPGLFLRLRGGGNGDGVRVSGRETRANRGRRVGG